MSGEIFQSELSSLIQESKRKHLEVKAAAETSLSDLKALRVTSEAQLAGDLLRKPSFTDPFILACKPRNAKLVTSSVVCLQRLAASHAMHSERLKDVLDALREVTSSGFDVQIKLLQTLPSLFQTYASDI
jgi:Dimerisation and cyclophilin-binding domain of Mon2